MANHFLCLLNAVAAAPATRVADLPLLTDAEHEQLLVDWNHTTLHRNGPASVHTLFEAQVRINPQACAAVFGKERLSYTDLNERANRLAHYLRRHGVGPDVAVAIHVERSLALPVALLGVLKAGGAYLPIDPGHPQDRIAFMLADVRPVMVLTERHLLATLPADGPPTLCLDSQWPLVARESATNPAPLAGPDHLAYIIYTSGSTGQPKGVAIAHKSIVNFLLSMARELDISADDRLLAVTTMSFDIAGLEIYLPLSKGATLILADRVDTLDAARLAQLIESHSITFLQATPATWHLLFANGWEGAIGLKALCGGEAMPVDLAVRLQGCTTQLWNLYGPTETTIWSTLHKVGVNVNMPIVPIGKPIANTRIYLLDRHQRPVPVGVAGELHIAGEALARGYLNRPGLTADKFIPDPFSVTPGQRMYKTGDLARYLPDGNIEYLGRIDRQLKLRGFRIEPGEIEAALAKLAGVREALVLLREDTPGEHRLVAYLTSQPDQTLPEPAQLRRELAERLPDYMVPAHFVALDSMPLTSAGKTDRNAFSAPTVTDDTIADAAPRNPIEQMLVLAWSEILGLEQVGIHVNFFEIGGHSLLAASLLARIRPAFEIELPLQLIFEAPTIALFAEAIAALIQKGPGVAEGKKKNRLIWD